MYALLRPSPATSPNALEENSISTAFSSSIPSISDEGKQEILQDAAIDLAKKSREVEKKKKHKRAQRLRKKKLLYATYPEERAKERKRKSILRKLKRQKAARGSTTKGLSPCKVMKYYINSVTH
jgi:hypothetical protein